MDFLLVSIKIKDEKILLVGGGKVAFFKATLLQQFTNNITILSENFISDFYNSQYVLINKTYKKDDLKDFFMVYACTDNNRVNKQIAEDCRELGILNNVVDDPDNCDFISPAIYKTGNMSIAISSDGKSVKSSINLRNQIKKLIENGRISLAQ